MLNFVRLHDIINWEMANFVSENLFEKHWDKHQNEYAGLTKNAYLEMAREVLSAKLEARELEEFVREDGSIARYRFSTNDFVVGTKNGEIRTFFKPRNGDEYWKYEHERNK